MLLDNAEVVEMNIIATVIEIIHAEFCIILQTTGFHCAMSYKITKGFIIKR